MVAAVLGWGWPACSGSLTALGSGWSIWSVPLIHSASEAPHCHSAAKAPLLMGHMLLTSALYNRVHWHVGDWQQLKNLYCWFLIAISCFFFFRPQHPFWKQRLINPAPQRIATYLPNGGKDKLSSGEMAAQYSCITLSVLLHMHMWMPLFPHPTHAAFIHIPHTSLPPKLAIENWDMCLKWLNWFLNSLVKNTFWHRGTWHYSNGTTIHTCGVSSVVVANRWACE